MRKYRDLFEQEFGGNSRLFDIAGPGLPLGVKTLTATEAFAILNGADDMHGMQKTAQCGRKKLQAAQTQIVAFAKREMDTLKALKDMLTRAVPPEPDKLEALLDTTDYLWAHFPECAGTGRRHPSVTDLSFLKRIRAEIDPFLKFWEIALERLTNGK